MGALHPDPAGQAGALRERLVHCFGQLPIPEAGTLLNPLGATDPAGAEGLRLALAGRHWRDLPRATLKARWSAWCYLSATGWRFYLPALLDAALAGFGDDPAFATTVTYLLNPSYRSLYESGHDAHLSEQQRLLDAGQYEAAVLFLAFMARHGDRPARANQALRHGWNRYLALPALGEAVRWQRAQVHWTCPPAEPESRPLVDRIEAAFANGACPPLAALSGSPLGDEPAELAIELSGLAWQRIAPSWLDLHSAALSFLSPAGVCHFLPAFMRADAMALLETDGPVFHLTQDASTLQARFEPLTPAQCEAVVAYLEFVREREAAWDDWDTGGIDEALERYWRPRLA